MIRVLTGVIKVLTERQLLVLQIIIDDFIETAHPVGSRALSKKGSIPYSAATIRNDMADLEDMGFLEKTHSSSGRIPSEKGYRYYVDHLIAPLSSKQNIKIIRNIMKEGIYEFEQIVQMSAEVLSELTNYTSIIVGPELSETKLKQLEILPISTHTAVAILVTDTGHVEHRSFTMPEKIDLADLEKMVNILNDRLIGVPIIRLEEVFQKEIVGLLKRYINSFGSTHHYLQAIISQSNPVKLYIGGKSNILMQPEFNDVDKIRSFYSMIENENEIANLLKSKRDGIGISIGNENKVEAIKDLSLITATYRLGKDQMGTIALLGPTRMEYKKVISLLSSLSKELSEALYKWYKASE